MATKQQIESLKTNAQKFKERKRSDLYISREVINSMAFKQLTGSAIRVYLSFLEKRVMRPYKTTSRSRPGRGCWAIENNGELQFTYREAQEKYGIPFATFRRAIDQLIEVGLIDITHQGTGIQKDVSLFGISERWRLYGTDEFVSRKRKKRRQHYGFAKGNTYGRNAKKENHNVRL